jgi:hypothetical protein
MVNLMVRTKKTLRFKRGTSPSQRFWACVEFNPGDCWIWRGTYRGNNYGCFFAGKTLEGKNKYVSPQVFAWEETNGSLPAGMEIHHRCLNPACINPLHLEALSHEDHIATRTRVTKEFCIRGHPLSGNNLYIISSTGYRRCRACDALRHLRSWDTKWERPDRRNNGRESPGS